MLTPDDIEGRDFLVSLRGFDRAEVRAFLADVAGHVRALEARVQAAEESQAASAAAPAEEPAAPVAETGRTPGEEQGTGPFADIGRETQRILEAAQEAAESIARQARVDADRQLQGARRQAARLIAEGEQRRDEAEGIVAGLEAARGTLSEQLRDVGATIERVIDELGAPLPPAATVREALAAELATRAGQPEAPEAAQEPPAAEAPPSDVAAATEQPADEEPPGADADEDEPPATPIWPDVAEEPIRPGVVEEPVGPEVVEEPIRPDEPEPASPDEDEPPSPERDRERPADPAPPTDTGAGADGADDDLAEVIALDEVADDPSDPSDPHGLRGSALAPLHPQLVRAVKRGLQDVQNVALDRLRRAGGEGEPESLLPGDEEVDAMGSAASGLLREAYSAGVTAASLLVDRDLPEPEADRHLVEGFLSDASERVRSPLAATLRMARSAAEDAPALFDRVGAVFAELRSTVAEELAATHLMRAYEFGLVDAWTAGGITHRRWVLGREPRCPEARCRHNDQAGVVAMGDTYPSGHEVPPVHVGCNCTTIPISEPPP